MCSVPGMSMMAAGRFLSCFRVTVRIVFYSFCVWGGEDEPRQRLRLLPVALQAGLSLFPKKSLTLSSQKHTKKV